LQIPKGRREGSNTRRWIVGEDTPTSGEEGGVKKLKAQQLVAGDEHTDDQPARSSEAEQIVVEFRAPKSDFLQLPNRFWKLIMRHLGGSSTMVYLSLYGRWRATHPVVQAEYWELAQEANVSRNTAKRATLKLRAHRLIAWESGKAQGVGNLYRLLPFEGWLMGGLQKAIQELNTGAPRQRKGVRRPQTVVVGFSFILGISKRQAKENQRRRMRARLTRPSQTLTAHLLSWFGSYRSGNRRPGAGSRQRVIGILISNP
jgi:hypothetical protein